MTKNQAPSRGPDYGIAKILRGFPNFEDYYQGLSRGIPIALSPYGSKTMGREKNAASNYAAISSALAKQTTSGPPVDGNVDGIHSPNLIDATPTVFGANCVFLLPRPSQQDYMPLYKLIWRVRAIDTFAQTQLPFHANLRGARYQDPQISTQEGWNGDPVLTGLAAQRGVMATVAETIRYTPPRAPATPLSRQGYQPALDLSVQPDQPYGQVASFTNGDALFRFTQGPILPFIGGNSEVNLVTGKTYTNADLGQNPLTSAAGRGFDIADGLALVTRTETSHVSYSTVAKGDEVIILAYNVPAGGDMENPGTFNFDAEDFQFSCLFGRGGYENPFGSIINPQKPLFPNGIPFGVYLVQGHG